MAQPTTSVRVRENQRRSRARRKEYIEGLEERLQKFERHGVQATIEVQAAARKVAKENNLLRSLLNVRGVSNSEIETFIWHSEGDDRPGAVKYANITQMPAAEHPGTAAPNSARALEKFENQDSPPRRMDVAPRCLAPASLSSQNGRVSSATTNESVHHQSSDSNEYATYKTTSGSMDSSPETDASMNNMTSCEYAARIIAGMRGDYDDEIVRTELGCSTNKTCNVDNMAIFYALDQ